MFAVAKHVYGSITKEMSTYPQSGSKFHKSNFVSWGGSFSAIIMKIYI